MKLSYGLGRGGMQGRSQENDQVGCHDFPRTQYMHLKWFDPRYSGGGGGGEAKSDPHLTLKINQ